MSQAECSGQRVPPGPRLGGIWYMQWAPYHIIGVNSFTVLYLYRVLWVLYLELMASYMQIPHSIEAALTVQYYKAIKWLKQLGCLSSKAHVKTKGRWIGHAQSS